MFGNSEMNHMTRGYMEAIEEVLNNPEKYGLISRERTFIIGGSLFDTLSTKSKCMTNEQDNKLSERVRKYTETFKDHPASVDFEMGKIAGFVKGVKDVVNNPSEYGLMATPTDREIEHYLKEVYGFSGVPVNPTISTFEHFKNRKS